MRTSFSKADRAVPRRAAWVLAPAVALLVTSCGGEPTLDPASLASESIQVSSPAIVDGQPIPVRFTCDGNEVSPPLSWTRLPETATSAALVVDDPDAPDGTFVHWVLLDIPRSVVSLAAGEVPGGVAQAENSSGKSSYAGPCPPSGTHHYRFTVYGLSAPTGLDDGVKLEDALKAIDETAVARGELVGTYRHR